VNVYPIVTTPEPVACRDFYRKALDARIEFETDWYVHLAIGGWEIGFLKPNPPQRLPVFQHARPSHGLTLAIEVPDIRAVHRQLTERGIETLGRPEQFASGELAFSVMDPAGVVLNFVEHRTGTNEAVVTL
jgi:catechol 2,3-dioxygenase-like lactoylglutathione lyase family enzyme